MIRPLFALLLLSVVLPRCVLASEAANVTEPPLNYRVERFTLDHETLLDGLKNLSSGSQPFSFGFEMPLRAEFRDVATPERIFEVDLKGKTIRELLDYMCLIDSRYAWSTEGAFVNIYPRATETDSSYLLNRIIPTFAMHSVSNINQALFSMADQLPPPREQVAHVQAGGDSSYPLKPWTESFGRLTVRQAVNRLCQHLGPNSNWVLSGSSDFRGFGFFRRWRTLETVF